MRKDKCGLPIDNMRGEREGNGECGAVDLEDDCEVNHGALDDDEEK
jgi:hypothetical protein